jgi:hypothetical protein
MNLVPTRNEVFTGEAAGTKTIAIWSHDAALNQPAMKLTEGSWNRGFVNSWQGANVTPIPLVGGQIVWIAWTPVGGGQASVEASGANLPGLQEYRATTNGGQSWTGPFKGHQWKFRIYCGGRPAQYEIFGASCPGSGRLTPLLAFEGIPTLGGSMSVHLTRALANAPALMSIGLSDSDWLGVPLPFDLTPLGAPGCRILASGQVLLVTAADAAGNGAINLTIPNDGSLVGGSFFDQYWVLDQAANTLGFAFTNGGRGTFGD